MVSIASCLVTGHPPRRVWFPFFICFHQVFIHIDEIPLSLLIFRLKSASSLSLSPFEKRYHRITQRLRLEGNLEVILFHFLAQAGSTTASCPGPTSSPLVIFIALHWIVSSSSISPLHWGAQNRTPGVASPLLSEREGSLLSRCWKHSS